jgi:hypothetical protein
VRIQSRLRRLLCCDFLVEAEVFFNRGDADFKLFAPVDFPLLKFGQLRVDAVDLGVELIDTTIQAGPRSSVAR